MGKRQARMAAQDDSFSADWRGQ